VVSQLQEYDLNLEYATKEGYRVAGDTIRIRALFFLYFNELRPLFDGGILGFFKKEEILGYYKTLKELEEMLPFDFVDGDLLSLAALLPLMNRNHEENGALVFPGLNQAKIIAMKEYGLIEQTFPSLATEEKIYLCLHILGCRIAYVPDDMFEPNEKFSGYGLTQALISEFEKVACVEFEQREALERALFIHIHTFLYRTKYGVQMEAAVSQDIMREYPNLFDLTRIVCKNLKEMAGLPIPESEIGYLALHFGAHLKIAESKEDVLRILIVCVNGISTGNMLKREIQKLLPAAEIVGVVSAMTTTIMPNTCDLVIATIKIKCEVPVIVVRPILTDEDRMQITNFSLLAGQKKYGIDNHLVHVNANGLMGFLDSSKIQVARESLTWEDSIYFAGTCLVENGSIENRYLDAIIAQTSEYGSYMFLTDDVLLAHAGIQDGVHRLDISMAVFREAVAFPNEHYGKIIFVLAAEDQEKHLQILNDLLKLCEEPESIQNLLNATTTNEILANLTQHLS
jgi:transcriptional antiterminator/mannitol/fructose-specific phosphotransferase system IIA component (Ntr-type)